MSSCEATGSPVGHDLPPCLRDDCNHTPQLVSASAPISGVGLRPVISFIVDYQSTDHALEQSMNCLVDKTSKLPDQHSINTFGGLEVVSFSFSFLLLFICMKDDLNNYLTGQNWSIIPLIIVVLPCCHSLKHTHTHSFLYSYILGLY